ncbi:MAG: hypothetical protein U0935_00585 [Pirellulales bacterium]
MSACRLTRMRRWSLRTVLLAHLWLAPLLAAQLAVTVPPALGDKESPGVARDRQALRPLQACVGEWRGAGQLKRGSTEGGWTEDSAWVWRFDDQHAAIQFTVARGKYFVSGQFRPGKEPGAVELQATSADGGELRYAGKLAEDGSLVVEGLQVPSEAPQRVTLRVVAGGDRLVMLLERRSAISDRYARLAEIGYTRKGSEFGKGSSQPECVVTGGLGTIQVSYQGQMYYVCCQGCRDLFEQKPAEILQEYRERKAAEAAKKKAARP